MSLWLCGQLDDCRCTSEQIKRYLGKISGPLLDRMDMHVEVARLPPAFLTDAETNVAEKSAVVRARVIIARECMLARQGKCNTQLSVPELDAVAQLEKAAQSLLHQVVSKYNLSARVYHRIIKLARTIADLEQSTSVLPQHISEALNYRCLDRARQG